MHLKALKYLRDLNEKKIYDGFGKLINVIKSTSWYLILLILAWAQYLLLIILGLSLTPNIVNIGLPSNYVGKNIITWEFLSGQPVCTLPCRIDPCCMSSPPVPQNISGLHKWGWYISFLQSSQHGQNSQLCHWNIKLLLFFVKCQKWKEFLEKFKKLKANRFGWGHKLKVVNPSIEK